MPPLVPPLLPGVLVPPLELRVTVAFVTDGGVVAGAFDHMDDREPGVDRSMPLTSTDWVVPNLL